MNYSLDKLMKQVRGVSYSKNDASLTYKEGFVPVLRAGNIQNSRIIHDDFVYIPKEGVKNVQLLKKGDVLIAASSGSISIVGKAAMILHDMNAGFGAFCKVLRPNKEIVNEDYFKFYFETPHYKNTISQLAEGANINNLKTEHFDNLEIYLPPLPQQQKIANILDAADALRQNDKALIAKYDELTQALFLDMFGDPVSNPKGWDMKIMASVCEKINVGFVGICEPYYTDKEIGIPMIRTGNLGEGFLRYDKMKYVTKEFHLKQRKSQIFKNDILIARHGDNGKAVLYNGEFDEANCLNIIILRPAKGLLNGTFNVNMLNNESTRNNILGKTGGATQKVVNTKEIQKLIVPLPPINLQNQFAERVAIIEEQKAIAQKSLEQSEELFNSLLQKAFKGEL